MEIEQAVDLIRAPGVAFSALAVVVGFILVAWVARTPWFIGFRGELRVRALLRQHLGRGDYHAIHDVTLPTSAGTTQIDHILVSRHGVFVIETKTMKGRIHGRGSERVWTQSVFGRTYPFLNPLRQNFKHVKAVAALLGLGSWQIHSIVVFAGDASFADPLPENVVSIRDLVAAIRLRRRLVLDDAGTREAIARLEGARIPILVAGWLHGRSLRERRRGRCDPGRAGTDASIRGSGRGEDALGS